MNITVPAHLKQEYTSKVSEFETYIKQLLNAPVIVEVNIRKLPNLITDDLIKDMVCEEFNVPWPNIIISDRSYNVADARMTYCYLVKIFLHKSDNEIGNEIKRHRTTVISACKTIHGYIQTKDPNIIDKINAIIHRLNAIKNV